MNRIVERTRASNYKMRLYNCIGVPNDRKDNFAQLTNLCLESMCEPFLHLK
jgi:hypothetical protein